MQLKHIEVPFHTPANLIYARVQYLEYTVPKCPCPVFLDVEMQTLVENATIDLEKLGMYRYLALTY